MANKALVTIFYGSIGTARTAETPPIELNAKKEPTAYSGNTSIMVDAGTSVSGHLLGSIVRNDVAQISLSWNYLSAADWAEINQRFKDEYINEVEFFDQTAGDWVKRDMHISDRSAGMHHRDSATNEIYWTGCSLQLMEV